MTKNFENNTVRGIFQPKREENDELGDLFFHLTLSGLLTLGDWDEQIM